MQTHEQSATAVATEYELVATQYSYYSAKVRAVLQYKRLPYREIGCSYDTLFNRVLKETGDAKFPVLFCADGSVLTDSCDIVEALEARHPERPLRPAQPVLNLVAVLLETLADEFFAAPFIYYRWVPEDVREWALSLFRILVSDGIRDAETLGAAQQVAEVVAGGIQDRVRKVGQDRADVQAQSQQLTQLICDALESHLQVQPFVLGDRPSLADAALMNGLFGHLFMDPCDASMYLRRRCPRSSLWMMRIHAAAGESDQGELYLSKSLLTMLEAMAKPFSEMAAATLAGVDRGVAAFQHGDLLPASLGSIHTRFAETDISVSAAPYVAWKLQRLREAYHRVPPQNKTEADNLLGAAGFLTLCQKTINWRLEKSGTAMRLLVSEL